MPKGKADRGRKSGAFGPNSDDTQWRAHTLSTDGNVYHGVWVAFWSKKAGKERAVRTRGGGWKRKEQDDGRAKERKNKRVTRAKKAGTLKCWCRADADRTGLVRKRKGQRDAEGPLAGSSLNLALRWTSSAGDPRISQCRACQ